MTVENPDQKINLLIVGIGPHAKRAYIPHILNLEGTHSVGIAAIVELKERESHTRSYFESLSLSPRQIYIERFMGDILPEEVRNSLDALAKKLPLHGVIIATEPQTHKPFAMWAIKNGLHVLMDKPITTRAHVVTSETEAENIYTDYQELLQAYQEQQQKGNTIFSVHVQRRYHTGFHKVFELIREVADRTGCPITSLQSTHADGQWRLPSELVDIVYHGYNQGYGKVSHSGYHFFDLAYQIIKSGKIDKKWPNTADVFTSFLLPSGLLIQLSEDDLFRCFGASYKKLGRYTSKELSDFTKDYGEIDANILLDLKKEGLTICQASINLAHNSFSRRSWLEPNSDLYKGNGRVKHETHIIQQGPFQSIHVHSYQMKDKHDKNTHEDYDFGGNNHFDIHVFRNAGVLGGDPYRKIRIDDILDEQFDDDPGLVIERIKRGVVKEFLDAIKGAIDSTQLVSSIEDHDFTTQLMSAVYLSHVRRRNNKNPVISFAIKD